MYSLHFLEVFNRQVKWFQKLVNLSTYVYDSSGIIIGVDSVYSVSPAIFIIVLNSVCDSKLESIVVHWPRRSSSD